MAVYYRRGNASPAHAAMAREAARRWGKLEFTGAFAEDPAAVKPAAGAALTGASRAAERPSSSCYRRSSAIPAEVTILAIGP